MGYPYRCVNRAMGRSKYKSQEDFEKASENACGYRETLRYKVHFKKCPKCGREMKHEEKRKAYAKSKNCWCGGDYGSSLSGAWPHQKGCFGCVHYKGPLSLEEEYYR